MPVLYVCAFVFFFLIFLLFLLFLPRNITTQIIFRNKWVHNIRMFRSFIFTWFFFLLCSINFFKKAYNVVAKLQRALLITRASVMLTDFFRLRFRLSFLACCLCSFFVLFLLFSLSLPPSRSVTKANVIETKRWLKEVEKMKAK